MADYKEFTEEEEKIYDREIKRLREKLQRGLSFDDTCSTIDTEDAELQQIIRDDLLKIMIAELHYSQGLSFEMIASSLKIEKKQIEEIHKIMIDDIMYTVNREGGFDKGDATYH